MNSYDHIIWDWNGTLLDDISISIDSVNAILHKYNKKYIDSSFH